MNYSNVGHFAYETFRLLDTSPTAWTLRLPDIPLLDTSPTPWTIRPLNVNTTE